ncbi:helix-turn-helix domain-containing protein [Natrinema sp. 1APR25-10V2]|uniref:helix-turn-helix domain-containing protein n=1 Tax=Natrinema sp. 1APR25-10V2 TaxID=2951081 RepID=UPI0028749D68|nr:helix-turn-helix domain-containing protein [Natrinema sp. 1APR25-10V2]MDS0475342.1 helix-turn-helix domain-containing protein [Natrinema sp. 1APR25-10V2]
MKRASFRVTYPDTIAHPLHRRLARVDGVSIAELLMWGPMGTVTTLLWFDCGQDTAAEVLTSVDSVETTDFVAGDDGTYVFVHQTTYEFEEAVLTLVSDSRVVFLPPIAFHGDGTVRFEAVGRAEALTAFYDELTRLADGTLERVGDFDRRSPPAAVTDRQREALEAAAAVGYYEVPRTGSVADVADELGCASSTAGELLRKAESALVASTVDGR